MAAGREQGERERGKESEVKRRKRNPFVQSSDRREERREEKRRDVIRQENREERSAI